MILHFLTNEQFADYAIAQFSAPEMESEFVLIPSNHENWNIKLIDRCKIVERFSPEYNALLDRLDQYSAIFFHGLFWGVWQKPILERVPKSLKVAWYFWGGEIYSRHELDDYFLAPITRKVYNLRHIIKRTQPKTYWEIPLSLYGKINYCLTSMREECDYARQFTNANFKHLWYTYYSIEETIGGLMNEQSHGDNIWIGNSASIKNNHLDVLWQLWKGGLVRKTKGNKVIMPLSYGGQWVHNLVKKVGKFVLGKRLQVLDTYQPREEYNALMLSCSTLILGYFEPAAQGNIITGLWLGMRVYLSEKSMAYAYYKRIGAKVFTMEKDLKIYGFTPLSDDERAENRKVLNQWYSKEHVEQAVKDVVNELR